MYITAGDEEVDVRTNSLGYDGGDDFGGVLSIVETNGVLGGVMAFWEASYDCLEVAFNLTPRAYFGLIWLGLQACGHRPGVAGMGQFVADKESFYGVNSEHVLLDEAGLATGLPTLFYPSQLWNDAFLRAFPLYALWETPGTYDVNNEHLPLDEAGLATGSPMFATPNLFCLDIGLVILGCDSTQFALTPNVYAGDEAGLGSGPLDRLLIGSDVDLDLADMC